MLTVGGATLGKRATGIWGMAMAMPQAKTGRSMKNCAMALPAAPLRPNRTPARSTISERPTKP